MPSASDRPPPAAFEELYAAHFHHLTQQLFSYNGNLGDAQDLVQEAFCRALARWDSISRYEDPVAWVRRVAWNLAVSHWRRLRAARNFLHRQRSTDVPAPGVERMALVAALARLAPAQRRVVVLHYLADLPVAQIARQLGVTEGTVKSTLHRGRAALAQHVSEWRPTNHV